MMNKNGPVIIIEDDEDDQVMLNEIFKSLKYKNEVIIFNDGNLAFDYLTKTTVKPFLILSDINMPKINGLELRHKVQLNKNINLHYIPYLFFTTASSEKSVEDAYEMFVQGFFIKPDTFKKMEESIRKIMEYWKESLTPGEQVEY